MKIVKRVLIVFGVVIVLLVAAAIIIPIVFKDDIKAAIDKQIAKTVNADVIFDVDDFSLSVFKNFPNVTAQMKNLGVFNRAPFEGVPLLVLQELDVEVNLRQILFGDELRVKGIQLIAPQITVKVLKDGRANYDITYPSADTAQAAPDTSSFSFGIDHWEVVNGHVTYDDKSLPYLLVVKGLNHSGSGDFTQDVFDLRTQITADSVTTAYDGVEYLTDKRVEIDAVISISEDYSKFTFKDNTTKVNDFAMSMDGWVKMNAKDYDMDLAFKSPENSFKSLLSLVPGMYTKDFSSIKTDGDLQFSGFAKGKYSDTQMPAFNLTLLVNNAMFQYPDLPTAINNINVDLMVDNKDGVIEHTLVDLKKMHLDFGTNPVDARARIENLKDYRMDAEVKAKLNLAELNKMFPMEGIDMKGTFSVDAKANGVYDSIKKIIPTLDVAMTLADGYVKSTAFPAPLEDLKMSATVKNTTGKMEETLIDVPSFSMMLEGERFDASMTLRNLADYTWDVKAKGGVDLEKMTKIFPLDGMTVAGKVKANIETKGKMSDLEAERYDRLPTSGSASMTAFKLTMKDVPDVAITQTEMIFDPRKIELKNTTGTIGKSDFNVTGAVSNYIGYVFGKNETIKGNVDFKSNLLDLNEFMSDTEETTTTDTTSFGVIPIPQNIDFIFRSNVKTVKMMDYTMTNAAGDIILKDGVANLSGLKFNLLGGAFVVNGTYDTKDIDHPKYDFALKIQDLSIKEAAHSFSVVSTYAPVAGMMTGSFGTDFKINGELGKDMMPKMGTVNGAGLIKIAQASLTQSKLISGITSLTKLENTDNVSLKDVLMSASIQNGRLSVKPFDVKFGSYATNVAGSTGLDGTINYTLKMNVPAGKLGAQLQSYANQFTGNTSVSKDIPVTIGVGGTYNDPKPSLIASEQAQQVQNQVKEEVKQTTEAVKEEVKQTVQEKTQQAVQEAVKGTNPKDIINNVLKGDSTKKDSTKATQQLQNKLNNLLKKRKN
ncbi:MAG: AsmA-like C-terminal region-containing protein [Bacteroidota bacterium]